MVRSRRVHRVLVDVCWIRVVPIVLLLLGDGDGRRGVHLKRRFRRQRDLLEALFNWAQDVGHVEWGGMRLLMTAVVLVVIVMVFGTDGHRKAPIGQMFFFTPCKVDLAKRIFGPGSKTLWTQEPLDTMST